MSEPSAARIEQFERLLHSEPVPLVLLVDDNADTLDMYALGLQYAGFRVEKAHDGEEALRAVSLTRPDCIVADVRMPRMNGLEFRRVLGRAPTTAEIPAIAVTGFGSPAEISTARAAGFDSVLLKPCPPDQLAREIVRLLALGRDARRRAQGTSGRALQLLAKAARLQEKNAEMDRRHRDTLSHRRPQR